MDPYRPNSKQPVDLPASNEWTEDYWYGEGNPFEGTPISRFVGGKPNGIPADEGLGLAHYDR